MIKNVGVGLSHSLLFVSVWFAYYIHRKDFEAAQALAMTTHSQK